MYLKNYLIRCLELQFIKYLPTRIDAVTKYEHVTASILLYVGLKWILLGDPCTLYSAAVVKVLKAIWQDIDK